MDADDDYDPLAPVHVGAVDEEDDDQGSDHTAADPQRIVKVWLDDDGTLLRVRLSPIWHRKLGHRTLSEVFAGVMAAARIRIAPEPDEAEVDLTGVDFSGVMRFGRDPFTTLRLALDNVNRRWAEAAQRQLAARPATPRPVQVSDGDVSVRLDTDGRLVAVDFDDDYLDDADVREISDAIVRLTRQARAQYVPAEPVRDELAEIALEHDILMAGLKRMLAGKAPR